MIQRMTAMRITADKEKEQLHESPLFPCSAYFTDWKRGGIEGCPWHWHKELELMYVSHGGAAAEYGTQRAHLGEGDGFFCNTRVLHRFRIEGSEDCRLCYLVFDTRLITGGTGTVYHQKYVQPLISDHEFPGQFLYRSDGRDSEVLGRIRAAYSAAQEEAVGFEYDVRYHMEKALLLLACEHQTAFRTPCQATPQMERIKAMLDYIHAHFSETIVVSEMASYAGISDREAQRCFQAVFQMSPMRYIQNYRLQVAEEMLLDTAEPILSIGLACGFSNPSHFSKAFRTYRGCTPHVFRRRNIGSKE